MEQESIHAELYRHVEPAVARFAKLLDDDTDAVEAFRADLAGQFPVARIPASS
ncbi:MAG: hypothetical protein L0H64_10185 [Pseudonocardia sp.]|nr:hypothetical protein [Pseudonocardia sp.]